MPIQNWLGDIVGWIISLLDQQFEDRFMQVRTKYKILVTLLIWLLLIVAGSVYGLPTYFTSTDLGRSHSIFAPLAVLLDVGIYIALSQIIVASIFTAYDWYTSRHV